MKLIVGIIAIVMVLCGEVLADAVYVYPPDHQQVDAQYVWAWDDNGGLLLDNAGPDGPVDYGWRGGGDVAWYGRDFTGTMVGKDHGFLATFEYLYDVDGTLYLIVRDVAAEPDGGAEPGGGVGDPGDGCPTCCAGVE